MSRRRISLKKRLLQKLHETNKFEEHELPTLKAFYLPFDKAGEWGDRIDLETK